MHHTGAEEMGGVMKRTIAPSSSGAAMAMLASAWMMSSILLLVGPSCAFTVKSTTFSLPTSTIITASKRPPLLHRHRSSTANGNFMVRSVTTSTSSNHNTVPEGDSPYAYSNTNTDDDDDDSRNNKIVNTIDFPPPLTKFQRLQRATKFWTSALPIVFSYYTKETELRLLESFAGGPTTPYYNSTQVEHIWNEQHARGAQTLANTILSLKGFYVKTAQIIASRRDLFPMQYTDALSNFTDNVDPLPVELIKAVITKELLLRNEQFTDVFESFDEVPLGSASVAQVHRATLSPKFGSKVVAVKVQRPAIESKLMGDIANLKALAKTFANDLPLDYYTVFCELEKQLAYEFDFVAEAVAMDRIYDTISKDTYGRMIENPAVVMPRPVNGLVSRRGKREKLHTHVDRFYVNVGGGVANTARFVYYYRPQYSSWII
jgi:hypothetical protein